MPRRAIIRNYAKIISRKDAEPNKVAVHSDQDLPAAPVLVASLEQIVRSLTEPTGPHGRTPFTAKMIQRLTDCCAKFNTFIKEQNNLTPDQILAQISHLISHDFKKHIKEDSRIIVLLWSCITESVEYLNTQALRAFDLVNKYYHTQQQDAKATPQQEKSQAKIGYAMRQDMLKKQFNQIALLSKIEPLFTEVGNKRFMLRMIPASPLAHETIGRGFRRVHLLLSNQIFRAYQNLMSFHVAYGELFERPNQPYLSAESAQQFTLMFLERIEKIQATCEAQYVDTAPCYDTLHFTQATFHNKCAQHFAKRYEFETARKHFQYAWAVIEKLWQRFPKDDNGELTKLTISLRNNQQHLMQAATCVAIAQANPKFQDYLDTKHCRYNNVMQQKANEDEYNQLIKEIHAALTNPRENWENMRNLSDKAKNFIKKSELLDKAGYTSYAQRDTLYEKSILLDNYVSLLEAPPSADAAEPIAASKPQTKPKPSAENTDPNGSQACTPAQPPSQTETISLNKRLKKIFEQMNGNAYALAFTRLTALLQAAKQAGDTDIVAKCHAAIMLHHFKSAILNAEKLNPDALQKTSQTGQNHADMALQATLHPDALTTAKRELLLVRYLISCLHANKVKLDSLSTKGDATEKWLKKLKKKLTKIIYNKLDAILNLKLPKEYQDIYQAQAYYLKADLSLMILGVFKHNRAKQYTQVMDAILTNWELATKHYHSTPAVMRPKKLHACFNFIKDNIPALKTQLEKIEQQRQRRIRELEQAVAYELQQREFRMQRAAQLGLPSYKSTFGKLSPQHEVRKRMEFELNNLKKLQMVPDLVQKLTDINDKYLSVKLNTRPQIVSTKLKT